MSPDIGIITVVGFVLYDRHQVSLQEEQKRLTSTSEAMAKWAEKWALYCAVDGKNDRLCHCDAEAQRKAFAAGNSCTMLFALEVPVGVPPPFVPR